MVVRGHRQAGLEAAAALGLVMIERPHEPIDVGDFEVVGAPLALTAGVHIGIRDAGRPLQLPTGVNALQVHRETLEAVGDLDRNGVAVDAAGLLEVRELRHLHAVEPDLPARAPRTQRRRLPVVLDEANVVRRGVDPDRRQRAQVRLLNVGRRGLDQHLELVVVLQTVRILRIAAVCGANAGLHVGRRPRLGAETAQNRGGIHRARANLRVVRLHDRAALCRPERLQAQDQILKGLGCQFGRHVWKATDSLPPDAPPEPGIP